MRYMGDPGGGEIPIGPVFPSLAVGACRPMPAASFAAFLDAAPSFPDDCSVQLVQIARRTGVGQKALFLHLGLASIVGGAVGFAVARVLR